jgi:serine/threonine protein phosphatase 1
MGRTFCLGDIHGNLSALEQVLNLSKFSPTEDKLICLGDYVDRWLHSAEVVDLLISIKEQSDKHVFILGNHDEWCRKWLKFGDNPMIWEQQGGKETVESYIRTGLITSDKHKNFFDTLENYYIDEENRGFVHGGFTSRKGLGHEPHIANYYWDRDLWGLALNSHGIEEDLDGIESYLRFYKHKEVYIGHTSTNNWNCKPHYPEYKVLKNNNPITIPMNRCNVWNMDTGCGWKGKLTIMDIDTKEFWQSDKVEK